MRRAPPSPPSRRWRSAACGDADPSPPTPADLADIDLSPDHTITVDEDGYEPERARRSRPAR